MKISEKVTTIKQMDLCHMNVIYAHEYMAKLIYYYNNDLLKINGNEVKDHD